MSEIIKLAWERFGIIAAIVGDVVGQGVALLFYFTILLPFGLASRLFSDPLRQRPATKNAGWLERTPVSAQLEEAKKQG